jgi:flagellin-like hook-associated protein FlgL
VIVNTNLSALNAQRMLLENTKAASTVMERLATGSKINKAQDDVAGSAIADRMTAQVRGLNMAVKNANDALSMLAVAESVGLDQTDILQRIRELTLQASSDTNSAQDIEFLQLEVGNLVGEINRSSQTKFNGDAVNGLKTFQLGANSGQSLDFYFGTTSGYSGSVFGQATQDYSVGDSTIEIKGLSSVGPFAFEDMVLINGHGYFVQGVGPSPEIHDDGTFTQTISIAPGGDLTGLIDPILVEKSLSQHLALWMSQRTLTTTNSGLVAVVASGGWTSQLTLLPPFLQSTTFISVCWIIKQQSEPPKIESTTQSQT